MDDCGCDHFAIFDRRTADGDLRRYRSKGPDRTTAMLLDLIRAQGVEGASVLDIGGGVGVIDLELLESGAGRATLVDASAPSVAVAREAIEAAGLADRVTFIEGDAVRRASALEPSDIVSLDRVICCYPDVRALVGLAARRANQLLGIVLPRDRWIIRAYIRLDGFWSRLRGHAYRPYAHPNGLVDELIAAEGLQPVSETGTFIWRVALFRRPTPTV